MGYSASEELEIIRIVERSHLPTKVALDKLGVSRPVFYRWYDLYQRFGATGLKDKRSGPNKAWNRVPNEVWAQIIDLALTLYFHIAQRNSYEQKDTPAAITVVIFVGGLCLIGSVKTTLQQSFPTANFHASAVFTAVADGLAHATPNNR